MPQNPYTDATRRFLDILIIVAKRPVSTAFEIAHELNLPVSSTYASINEMERLSWLVRDEEGFLILGSRTHQIALNAHGYNFSARSLPPIVRYLREQTGQTAFAGNLTSELQIGSFLTGYNINSVSFAPFQKFRLGKRSEIDKLSGTFRLQSLSGADYDTSKPLIDFIAIPLCDAMPGFASGKLVVGLCWQRENIDEAESLKRLHEVQSVLAKNLTGDF